MENYIIKVENLSKEYKLGQIGGGTLTGDLQSWWARFRGKEDPNSQIGEVAKSNSSNSFFALNNVNFEIKAGERVGIIGHNGAGKSTLLKLLSRVTSPTTGQILYKGKIASMLEVGTGFHPELTGRENVYLNGAILGMKVEEIDRKFQQIVQFAEMEQFIDTPVKRYSSGMYVKLAFAVAAHLDSDILIMDEVLAVGDMKFQQKCLGTMGDISSSEGRTILYVSHNMHTVRQLCNRCIVMNHGQIVFDGDVEKAIKVYMGDLNTFNTSYDLKDIERKKGLYSGSVHLNSFDILNLEDSALTVGSKLEGRMSYNILKDVESFKFRVTIKLLDGTPVTMSSIKSGFEQKVGSHSLDIVLDTSNLVPGKYCMDLIVNEVNGLGAEVIHDVIRQTVPFEVVATDKFNDNCEWNNAIWGNCFVDSIEIKNNI